MNTETRSIVVIVPGLIYTWRAIEHLIGDTKSHESVIVKSNGGSVC